MRTRTIPYYILVLIIIDLNVLIIMRKEKCQIEFNVEDLFELASMAFAVEISLAVARKDTSGLRIKNKQDLYQVLTNREVFDNMLEQEYNYILFDIETFNDLSKFNQLQKDCRDKITDYFMTITNKIKLEELRF